MSFLRPLTGTDIRVSALGLGTVKFGRNQGVKYPRSFSLPDDAQLLNLLALANELGINFIDTAPAYGNSEERLGKLLTQRQDWVLASKVGEEFEQGVSRFDFSAQHTRASVERSLRRLQTDYLDIVLIHSDGNDASIIRHSDCLDTLITLRDEGLVRAVGMSTKTLEGGMLAVDLMDVVMVTYNLQQQDKEVVDYAQQQHKGIIVKKGLMSGHVHSDGKDLIRESMQLIFSPPGISSMIVGTIDPEHLSANVKLAREVLASV